MQDNDSNSHLAKEAEYEVDKEPPLVRRHSISVAVVDSEEGERFLVRQKSFVQQFAAIYFMRLKLLKEVLTAVITPKLAKNVKICDTTQNVVKGVECVIIGTMYKEMALKPCILDEYKDKKPSTSLPHFRSPEDTLVLEDEDGRIKLESDSKILPVQALCTGIVVALRGREGEGGLFAVEEVYYPGLPPQKPIKLKENTPGRYAILLSGLQLGEPTHNPLPTQMVVDYISGFLGGSEDHEMCAKIETVIIAGDSLYRDKHRKAPGFKVNRKEQNIMVAPLKSLDLLLTQLAASVQVDLMCGDSDPSNYTLPQQPLHACLFPSTRTYSTFKSHSNPCVIEAGETRLLGTSGQNINDMSLYAEGTRMEHLTHTLEWRIMAPTAPDTLPCYPFQKTDPFFINDCPHVYFAGNQPSFDTQLLHGSEGQTVRLILVPSFHTTSTVVLLNLDDLSVIPICFKAPNAEPCGDLGEAALRVHMEEH